MILTKQMIIQFKLRDFTSLISLLIIIWFQKITWQEVMRKAFSLLESNRLLLKWIIPRKLLQLEIYLLVRQRTQFIRNSSQMNTINFKRIKMQSIKNLQFYFKIKEAKLDIYKLKILLIWLFKMMKWNVSKFYNILKDTQRWIKLNKAINLSKSYSLTYFRSHIDKLMS